MKPNARYTEVKYTLGEPKYKKDEDVPEGDNDQTYPLEPTFVGTADE